MLKNLGLNIFKRTQINLLMLPWNPSLEYNKPSIVEYLFLTHKGASNLLVDFIVR